ncbi:magnesium chelatase subunit D [Yoonia litorea]|uniref:Magnesium chelatase subunit D n=1 Tax=Yoonia litorea TaxID=1123755 RepID=A0A1I6MW14_9RHOB|nr:magnesium chelatase subunit D [Yoonia litorea]SFS19869.1 magnesium chelatase subunit D [Yoonia litorea]
MANESWHHATLALQLIAIDPGLGGICIKARSGPVRERLSQMFPADARRIHPAISDEALYGGLDLSATLARGELVKDTGLLSTSGPLLLTMAERASTALAARLAVALDTSNDHTLIALDEGAEPDEALNPKLAERLAFFVDLSDCALRDCDEISVPPLAVRGTATISPDTITQITRIAEELGIDSLRAPLFAIRAAKALAAFNQRTEVIAEDVQLACAMTFAHRATRVPEEPQQEEQSPPQNQSDESQDNGDNNSLNLPDELLLEAVRALLPDNLFDQLAAQKARAGRGNGTGAARKGNRRGRPLPSRAGRLSDGARIDIIGTLRAAAPWQTIRRRATGREGLHIHSSDIHIKRYEEKSDRLLIFTVDASGSSALTRLAEAKGAVELLLTQAYARRDHVCLIAFRGTEAELLLPPTRSLVQTKRRLAALPGGGGTPLAAGMLTAFEQSAQAARRGLTPTIAILTDGRANIALDGSVDRKQAAVDAQTVAKSLRAAGTDAIIIDTGNRPEPALRNLSQILDGAYLPLPRADAERLSKSVATVLES